MSIRRRVENLENQYAPAAPDYPVHHRVIKDGHDPGHTRDSCPACAAMTDDEYAAYSEWCERQRGKRVLCVVINLKYDGEPSNESEQES